MFAQSQPPDRGQPAVRNPFLPFGVPNQDLTSIVQSVFSEIQHVSGSWPEHQNQNDLFADVGEYIVKCSEILAEMADKLVNNPHLLYQLHTAQQQQQQWNRGFSDPFYLSHKHESLKSISSTLRATADNLRLEWSKSDHPPHHQPHHQQHHQAHQHHQQTRLGMTSPYDHHQQSTHQSQHRLPTMSQAPVSSVISAPNSNQSGHTPVSMASGIGPSTAATAGAPQGLPRRDPPVAGRGFAQQHPYQQQQQGGSVGYTSDQVYPSMGVPPSSSGSMEPIEDEISALDEERVRQLLGQPQHRGVGQHYCPLADRCDKGGVSPDGSIRVFERNSDFRTHLKKHVKMYKCPVPGCKNVEGFGRKDQLERHIRTTKHGPNAPGVGVPGQPQPMAQPTQDFPPMAAHRY